MKLFFTVLVTVFLLSCGSAGNNDDGGGGAAGCPCLFEYTTLPARVVKIEKEDSAHSDVLLKVEGMPDTISYCNSRTPRKECPLSNARLKRDSIEVGAIVRFIRGKRTNPDCGSCPIMEDNRIVLKQYEAGKEE
jgi:hypothetical protein